jgi:hypothetical protein
MKRLVLVAMLAGALAACGDAAEESDDTTAEETVAAPEPEAASSWAGSYEVTPPEGDAFTAMLNADGTYQDMDAAGKVTESGTWEERDDGQVCFDSEGGDDTIVCFTAGEPAEDGSIVVTPDDGTDPLTIKKTT